MNCTKREKQVILYGAGHYGREWFDFYGSERVFAFSDKYKHGTEYLGKPVLHPTELIDLCEVYDIIISMQEYDEAIEYLRDIGVNVKSINAQSHTALCLCNKKLSRENEKLQLHIEQLYLHAISDKEKSEEYYSCDFLESGWLVLANFVDNDKIIQFCCGNNIDPIPSIPQHETIELTLQSYLDRRAAMIAENKLFTHPQGERVFTTACIRCNLFQLRKWGKTDHLIHWMSLGMLPAPCQCKCIYCAYPKDSRIRTINIDKQSEYFNQVFNLIEYAQNHNIIAEDVHWRIGTGEITIHPYKERIYDFIQNQTTGFFTNCFLYDDKIAEKLFQNPQSTIIFSIDSGTPETWRQVKRVNNFSKVVKNLCKYAESCTRPEQIQLKYIILPGINDNKEDYLSLLQIMKKLKVKKLLIGCDRNRQQSKKKQSDTLSLLEAAGQMIAVLLNNKIEPEIWIGEYSLEERDEIYRRANKHLC